MPGRWSWPDCRRGLVACAAASLAIGTARAQTLDLSGPKPPAPGDGRAALALGELMDQQASALLPRDGPGVRATAALRVLARDLLTRGERAGPDGSEAIVLGRTIARALPGLDAMLVPIGDDDALAPVADLLAFDLDRVGEDPDSIDSVWRLLRDALAPLLEQLDPPPGGHGWNPGGEVNDAPEWSDQTYEAWRQGGLTQSAIDALGRFARVLDAGQRWHAYAESARGVRAVITRAGGVLAPHAWLQSDARARLVDAFDDAARQIDDPARRIRALESFRALATTARVLHRFDALDAPEARSALSARLAQMTSPLESVGAMEAIDRLALLLGTDPGQERTLAGPVRPPWRAIRTQLRFTRQSLESALVRSIRGQGEMSDPGVLSAVAGHRRTLDQLARLRRLGERLDPPGGHKEQPAAAHRRTRLGRAVLAIWRRAGKDIDQPAALGAIGRLATGLERFEPMPGEAELARAAGDSGTDPGGDWSAAIGATEGELLDAIHEARDAWLDAWIEDPLSGATAHARGRAERLALLMETLRDAIALSALIDRGDGQGPGGTDAAPGAIQSWPGWEMSPAAMRYWAMGLDGATAEATPAAIDAADDAGRKITALREQFAPALLIGRLERLAGARGLGQDPNATRSVLYELASGVPGAGGFWLGDLRRDLAHVCRYSEELAAARAAGDEDRVENVRAFVLDRAARVLEQIAGR